MATWNAASYCFVLFYVIIHADYSLTCPERCLCFEKTVRCMFLQLENIPTDIPPETTIFDLRFNKIASVPAGVFRGLTKLNTILLNNNHIETIENGAFEGLSELQYLFLYKNSINNIGSKAFHGLNKLEQLYLHYNDIEQLDPETFGNLAALERLFLHNNKIKRVAPGLFSGLKSLRRLRLDSNALICDCQMMWLSSMLKKNQGFTELAATCQFPTELQGKSFLSVSEELHCEKPRFTAEPNDLEVAFGGTASFHCRAEGDPQPEIIWLHNDQQINSNTIDNSGHYNVLDDGTLMIKNIVDGDQGVYECLARNVAGESMARPAKLRTERDIKRQDVNTQETITVERQLRQLNTGVRPRITIKPSDYSLVEGETVSLDCKAHGDPHPALRWTKNDLPLPQSDRYSVDHISGSLVIRGVRFEDRGLYRCTATNTQGSTSETGRLKILVAPTFTEKPAIQNVITGQSAYFTCRAEGQPKPEIQWLKDGRPMRGGNRYRLSEGGSTLWVTQVTIADRGVFDCQIENEAGRKVASAQLLVKKQLAPTLRSHPQDSQAFVGASVRFHCSVSADPPPSITWFKNGAALSTSNKYEIQANEESLLIRDVNSRDQGTYECVAENVAGSVRAFATLTVFDNAFPGNINPVIDNEVISRTVNEVRREVNSVINNTLKDLYDRSKTRTPQDLLALFRLPSVEALEITRSAEIFERTLETLHHQIAAGANYNISHKEVKYEDILTPFQLAIVANLSNCAVHREVSSCNSMCFHHKYRTFDGTCNNLRHPMWGASLTALNRILPPTYENGFNTPRGWDLQKEYNGFLLPSARLVSLELASSKEITVDQDFTHMLMQWGQFIDHDLDFVPMAVSNARFSDGRHCNETCENQSPCFPIQVPRNDPRIRRHRCLGVTRSSAMCGSGMTSIFFHKPAQREQINQITSYMDASNIYGSGEEEARGLRDFSTQTGYLRTGFVMPSGKPLLPPNNGEPVDCQMDPNKAHIPCFQAGDHRANEQLGLLSMHTVWLREHNRVAEGLRQFNPHWDGDMLYHEARKLVGAELQHITYTHWLPKILGRKGMQMLGPYKGYDPNVDTTIINSFATAAFRFGHSLINPVIFRLNSTFRPIREGNLPLHKAFFAPFRIVEEGGIDPVLRGLFARSAKKLQPNELLNTELTEKLFKLAHEVALDLAALNIQRGRDHGLPTYNDVREYCGLRKAETFRDFQEISNQQVRIKLRELYGHPDNVDLWVGGLTEDVVPGAKVGPTLLCVIVEQFKRVRDGDRFWYENPGVFNPSQLSEIKQITLARVLCENGDNINTVQKDAFTMADYPSGFLSCDDEFAIPKVDLKVWAHCCQDCSRAGSFHSITSHYRGRRSVEYSYQEDSPFIDDQDNDININRNSFVTKDMGGVPKQDDNNNKETHGDHTNHDNGPHSQQHDHEQGTTMEDIVHMSHSMMDSVDVRIEGMEEAMNDLQRLIKRLKRKVRYLEQKLAAPTRLRTSGRSQCVDHRGNLRDDKDKWKENDCKSCLCNNGRLECTTETCQLPTCRYPKKIHGQCCVVC